MPTRPTGASNLALVALALAVACGDGSSAAPPASTPAAQPADPTGQRETAWRYLPTLRDAAPSDVTLEPVVEVASPDQARLHIVAATHRPTASPPLRVELWSFSQHNAKGTLALVGEPELMLRIDQRDAEGAPALDALRRHLAAPSSQRLRPIGIDVDGPAALIAALSTAATIVRDDDADPHARVLALATVIRGLDDAVVFDARGLAPAVQALATGAWTPLAQREISSRRIAVSVAGADPSTLEVSKKTRGWAVTALPAQR